MGYKEGNNYEKKGKKEYIFVILQQNLRKVNDFYIFVSIKIAKYWILRKM